MQAIKTKVKRVLYQAPEPSAYGERFTVLLTDHGKVVCFTDSQVPADSEIEITGKDEVRNGEIQFKASKIRVLLPQNPLAYIKFCFGNVFGLGDKKAEKAFADFGESWPEHIQEFCNDQQAVELEKFIRDCDAQKEKTEFFVFASEIGLTENKAKACWDRWTASAITRISSNPYCLTEVDGVGFLFADRIGLNYFKVAVEDERRIRAAIFYVLEDTNGNTVSEWSAFFVRLKQLLGIYENDKILKIVDSFCQAGRVVLFDVDEKSFVTSEKMYKEDYKIFNFVFKEGQ